jgi:hypothetical protein
MTDNDDGKAGRYIVVALQARDMTGDRYAKIFSESFAIDDFCGHIGLVLLAWKRGKGPAFSGFDIRDAG